MENERKENFSKGIHDGWNFGLDPLGVIFTYVTGIKTYGSEGHKAGKLSEDTDYNPKSLEYRIAKASGITLGIGTNILLGCVPQAAEIAMNIVDYSKLNKK